MLFLPQSQVAEALAILREFSTGRWATQIGEVLAKADQTATTFSSTTVSGVRLQNAYGVERQLGWHTVDQLPRIC